MQIRPFVPDLLVRGLQGGDASAVARAVESARGKAEGARQILHGMCRFAGHHRRREGEWPATVVLDAVRDLLPTCRGEEAGDLLLSAGEYLLSLPAEAPRLDRLELTEEDRAEDVVPISILEDALAEGEADGICRAMARLVRVIATREVFLEIVLEGVAADPLPHGRRWVHASACVKALHELGWEEGRAIAVRLAEDLERPPIPPAASPAVAPPPVPVRAAFDASLGSGGAGETWPYLAHAFQGERYAEMRRRGVRAGLRAWIAERLFTGDEPGMDALEAAFGPIRRSDPAAPEVDLPEREGKRLAEAIASGADDAADLAADWAARLPDVDPLYRWLAAGLKGRLARGDGAALVTANAARWGAHLLGVPGAERITRALVVSLAAGPR